MEVYERLDDLVDLVEGARGVPLSDSCVVNRSPDVELLEAVRALMPASLRDAATILADRDDVLEDAAREAESRIAGGSGRGGRHHSPVRRTTRRPCVSQAAGGVRRVAGRGPSRTPPGSSTEPAPRPSASSPRTRSGWRPSGRRPRPARAGRSGGLPGPRRGRHLRGQAAGRAGGHPACGPGPDRSGPPSRKSAAPSPAAVNAQSTGSRETAIYDFTQDPAMAEDLGGVDVARAARTLLPWRRCALRCAPFLSPVPPDCGAQHRIRVLPNYPSSSLTRGSS